MKGLSLTIIALILLPFIGAGFLIGWIAIAATNGWLWAFRYYDYLFKDYKK